MIDNTTEVENIKHDPFIVSNVKKIAQNLQDSYSGFCNLKLLSKPHKKTLLSYHNTCFKHGLIHDHNPVMKIKKRRHSVENPDRLTVLLQPPFGILLSDFFMKYCNFKDNPSVGTLGDITRIHDFKYIHSIKSLCDDLKQKNSTSLYKYGKYSKVLHVLDSDTYLSADTFDASLCAVGSVIDSVDSIMKGDFTNAFCVVRPPGHHAGHFGKVV